MVSKLFKSVFLWVLSCGAESRPNVSIDAFSLRLNNALFFVEDVMPSIQQGLDLVARKALENAGITADAVHWLKIHHEVAEELIWRLSM